MSDLSDSAGINAHRFPCDTCGSDLRYGPGTQELVCDHCGNREALSLAGAKPIREVDFRETLRAGLDKLETEQIRITDCPNCGARVEFDSEIHANDCPFCATPVVVGTGDNRHIKPHGLVPFVLSEDEARDAMRDWLGSLWFAPSSLGQYARKGRRFSGLYLPYWTYDADTRTRYSGERGTVYYTTRQVIRDGKRRNVRVAKTRWRAVSGRVARSFDDILVIASNALPDKFVRGLGHWDLSHLTPFTAEYLAGFRSEAYAIEVDDGFQQARASMDQMISRDIRFDIGGDKQRIRSAKTEMDEITFKHVLLPVWMAAYRYRGKSYRFAVNGQTGVVEGQRPWSWIKIAFAALILALIAAGIGYVIALQEGRVG